VTSFEELDQKVYELADRLASGATLAINATKLSVNLLIRKMLEGAIEAHLGQETYTYLSKDHYEAASSFRDKRTPNFTGT
jgi:enoyl-CoA hydratase